MPSLVDYVEAGNHSAAAMEAKLPRMKTPGYFPNLIVPGPRPFDCTLAEGDYVAKAGLVLLAGEADTGETHLATRPRVAACRQRRRVRLHGDRTDQRTSRGRARQPTQTYARSMKTLICIDEIGYVPLAETACKLMFQVIADRAEKVAVIVTTNLPISEWSQVIANPRLCKALIDRLPNQAHIIVPQTPIGSAVPRFSKMRKSRQGGQQQGDADLLSRAEIGLSRSNTRGQDRFPLP
jgi:hypothetical protein